MYQSINKIGIDNKMMPWCNMVFIMFIFKVNLPRSGDEEGMANKHYILKLDNQKSNFA